MNVYIKQGRYKYPFHLKTPTRISCTDGIIPTRSLRDANFASWHTFISHQSYSREDFSFILEGREENRLMMITKKENVFFKGYSNFPYSSNLSIQILIFYAFSTIKSNWLYLHLAHNSMYLFITHLQDGTHCQRIDKQIHEVPTDGTLFKVAAFSVLATNNRAKATMY